MSKKTIVIIGAGVSGLSAGIYAEQHGFRAILLEKNPSVGGMCTGWYRKGYYLDGCIHWLTGTKEGTLLNRMWKNLGAIDKQEDICYLDSWELQGSWGIGGYTWICGEHQLYVLDFNFLSFTFSSVNK